MTEVPGNNTLILDKVHRYNTDPRQKCQVCSCIFKKGTQRTIIKCNSLILIACQPV